MSWLRSTLAFAALSTTVWAQSPNLPSTSPFAAPAGSQPAGSAPEGIEFAGVSVLGDQTMISLYDTTSKHGNWIAVGGKSNGTEVISYDPKREQVVVRMYGQLKILNLRRGSVSGAMAASPVSIPVPPEPAAAVAVATPGTESGSSAPGEKKQMTQRQHEEEEARMFVSDMLEIGMQHRKAYEDAQKNSGPSAGLTSGVPVGTPYTPTLFPAAPTSAPSEAASASVAGSGATPVATPAAIITPTP